MYTCVVIPPRLCLVLTLHPDSSRVLEMSATIWSHERLSPSTLLFANEGELRLDRLDNSEVLPDDDIRREFGCYDVIEKINGHDVRFCNWVRFVRVTTNPTQANVLCSMLYDGQAVYQVAKTIEPNQEIVVFFPPNLSRVSPHASDVISPRTIMSLAECTEQVKDFLSSTKQSKRDDSSDESGIVMDSPSPIENESIDVTSDNTTVHDDVGNSDTLVTSHEDAADEQVIVEKTTGVKLEVEKEQEEKGEKEKKEREEEKGVKQEEERKRADYGGCARTFFRPSQSPEHQEEIASKKEGGSYVSPVPPREGSSMAKDRFIAPELRPQDAPEGGAVGTPLRGRVRKWLKCPHCIKKFDRPSLLQRHIRTHTGEKPHICEYCNKGFSTSSSLNTHRRIHSGEKPHQCLTCGKRFTASSNLYYHRMTHRKDKPHKCTRCPKSFPTPGDLRCHEYVHTGNWPFTCEVCKKGFSKATNLNNHMRLHSGDKPHHCAHCPKTFALRCNLKAHLKTHEGLPTIPTGTPAASSTSTSTSTSTTTTSGLKRRPSSKNNKKSAASDFSIGPLSLTVPRPAGSGDNSPSPQEMFSRMVSPIAVHPHYGAPTYFRPQPWMLRESPAGFPMTSSPPNLVPTQSQYTSPLSMAAMLTSVSPYSVMFGGGGGCGGNTSTPVMPGVGVPRGNRMVMPPSGVLLHPGHSSSSSSSPLNLTPRTSRVVGGGNWTMTGGQNFS
ncbi:hypothetical protein ACOMHN_005874 [Nucella lapillus]